MFSTSDQTTSPLPTLPSPEEINMFSILNQSPEIAARREALLHPPGYLKMIVQSVCKSFGIDPSEPLVLPSIYYLENKASVEEMDEIDKKNSNWTKAMKLIKSMVEDEDILAYASSEGRFKNCYGAIHTPVPSEGSNGYCRVQIQSKLYQLGLLILVAAVPEERQIGQISCDHINSSEPWNNNLTNLRFANGTEQAENRNMPSDYNTGKSKDEASLLEGEDWKEYKETGHSFSNFGRHRTARFPDISFTPSSKKAYIQIDIGGEMKSVNIIIAELFLDPPDDPSKTDVNHINGNTHDNRASNLEWITPRGNIQHSYETNMNRKSSAPSMSKPLLGKKLGDEEWTSFPSSHEASRKTKCDRGNISACANKRIKTTGGWEFKYDESSAPPPLLPGEVWFPIRHSTLALYSRITSGQQDVIEIDALKKKIEKKESGGSGGSGDGSDD